MVEFKTKKVLTLPLFKLVVDTPSHFKITGPMYIGKDMKQKEGDKKKEPATLANVTNLETGEAGQFIVNAVVKSVLTDEYPNDAYVGKCFAITKQKRKEGKSYDPFNVVEIEDPSATEVPTVDPSAAHATRRR
jgi:hypothetical protein